MCGRRKHEAVFLKTPLTVSLPEAAIGRFYTGESKTESIS